MAYSFGKIQLQIVSLPPATKNHQADYPPALLTIYGQFKAASLLSRVGGLVAEAMWWVGC